MPNRIVAPVLSSEARTLCFRRYPGHPHGCPNYGQSEGCPPWVPVLQDVINLRKPITVVWNVFDLLAHGKRMGARHPDWSLRQIYCCLYWQGTARKDLRREIRLVEWELGRRYGGQPLVLVRPEAHGVDVTATMKKIGIELEWPPRIKAYQVALVGTAQRGLDVLIRQRIGEF